MKLTTATYISLDGVMQGPGGSEEDRRDGFERGGWAMRLLDSEARAQMSGLYARADGFLFGRRTYEIFAGYWPFIDNPEQSAFGGPLNTKPKYVASSGLTDPEWQGTTVLQGELASAVGELKTQTGGEVLVPGSGALIRSLLEQDLVDEVNLFTCPVVVGQGTRLFPERGPNRAFELTASRATASGVIIQAYRPTGHLQGDSR